LRILFLPPPFSPRARSSHLFLKPMNSLSVFPLDLFPLSSIPSFSSVPFLERSAEGSSLEFWVDRFLSFCFISSFLPRLVGRSFERWRAKTVPPPLVADPFFSPTFYIVLFIRPRGNPLPLFPKECGPYLCPFPLKQSSSFVILPLFFLLVRRNFRHYGRTTLFLL